MVGITRYSVLWNVGDFLTSHTNVNFVTVIEMHIIHLRRLACITNHIRYRYEEDMQAIQYIETIQMLIWEVGVKTIKPEWGKQASNYTPVVNKASESIIRSSHAHPCTHAYYRYLQEHTQVLTKDGSTYPRLNVDVLVWSTLWRTDKKVTGVWELKQAWAESTRRYVFA